MVNPSREVVLAGNLRSSEAVICGVAGASGSAGADIRTVRQGIELQITLDLWVHSHKRGCRAIGVAEKTLPGRQRGDEVLRAQAKHLAQPFVITEDESLALADRASRRRTELIAPERGNASQVEKVPGIE